MNIKRAQTNCRRIEISYRDTAAAVFKTRFSCLYVNDTIITSSLFLNKWSADFKRYSWQQVYKPFKGKNIVVRRFSNDYDVRRRATVKIFKRFIHLNIFRG